MARRIEVDETGRPSSIVEGGTTSTRNPRRAPIARIVSTSPDRPRPNPLSYPLNISRIRNRARST